MNKKNNVLIGIAKCPQTKKLYGVRVETNQNRWSATWAFPIKPEVAAREGYTENQFPPDLLYEREYPGCPYCKKREDLASISSPPPRPRAPKIYVTSSGCDDIGSILSSMKIAYSDFGEHNDYNCDILFVNCLTRDYIDPRALQKYVKDGGCLYASCYADSAVKSAFPGVFETDHTGRPHTETVIVEDRELREIVGETIQVEFDTAWAKLYRAKNGTCILRSTQRDSLPIMVSVKIGKGIIFYTCFHNHVQASEKEKALLQLLVLKQIGTNENMTIDEAGRTLGIDIEALKAKFRSNF